MTQIASQPCIHCRQPNPVGSTFCSSCGKALPTGMPAGPRVLGTNDLASTAAGQKIQGDELLKQAKKAAGALLTVAILMVAGGVLMIVLLQSLAGRGQLLISYLDVGLTFGVAIVYFGLYVWARTNPLPPAIIGLVLFVTLTILQYIILFANLDKLPQPAPGSSTTNPGIPGGVPWVKIIIIVVLVQAIKAGSRHRKLMQQQQAGY